MGNGQYITVLERIKYVAEDYMAHFPPERRGAILLGALTSVYGKEEGGMDTAVWVGESKEKRGKPQLWTLFVGAWNN